ncbi:MAG: hypothetical protein ACOZAO_05845 [Patescibacteria group bacterium]
MLRNKLFFGLLLLVVVLTGCQVTQAVEQGNPTEIAEAVATEGDKAQSSEFSNFVIGNSGLITSDNIGNIIFVLALVIVFFVAVGGLAAYLGFFDKNPGRHRS